MTVGHGPHAGMGGHASTGPAVVMAGQQGHTGSRVIRITGWMGRESGGRSIEKRYCPSLTDWSEGYWRI